MSPAGGFFGVYLLYCLNPKHPGRVYVGFTVDPARRAQQHNGGRKKGGAWRTSGRGPREMVLIVHGFPSAVAALRELCPPPPPHVPLAFGPPPPRCRAAPSAQPAQDPDSEARCSLCARELQDEEGPLCCPHPDCPLRAHMICLAELFLQEEPQQLLPLEGECPGCRNSVLWGDLIWLSGTSHQEAEDDEEFKEAHWTDMLETDQPPHPCT